MRIYNPKNVCLARPVPSVEVPNCEDDFYVRIRGDNATPLGPTIAGFRKEYWERLS